MQKSGGKSGGKISAPSVSFLFDARKNPKGVYTVLWRVSYQGQRKEFSTGIKLPEDDVNWLKENKVSPDGRLKDDRRRNLWNMVFGVSYIDEDGDEMESLSVIARNVIRSLEFFSFEAFKSALDSYGMEDEIIQPEQSNPELKNDLLDYLENQVLKYKNAGQIGSSNSHNDTRSSLLRFLEYIKPGKNPILPFTEVTVEFLQRYESWMLQFGKAPRAKITAKTSKKEAKLEKYQPKPASEATVGIYARYMRKGLLEALEEGIITKKQYPFSGKNKFVISDIENAARSLPREEIAKVLSYVPAKNEEKIALSYWKFSYLGNGINMKDLCLLRKEHYNTALCTITFFREKTKNTSKGAKRQIEINLFPAAIEIINEFGSKNASNPYLFPILVKDAIDEAGEGWVSEISPARIRAIVNQFRKTTNFHLATVSKTLNLSFTIRTNDARDTHASVLAENDAPLTLIQRNLGQADPKTTTRYIGRFSTKKKKKIMSALLPGGQGDID